MNSKLVKANQIQPSAPVRWLAPFIPLRAVTLAYGDGGVGKTTFFNWLATQVTLGKAEGVYDGQGKDVIILNRETEPGAMRAKLEACGADTSRLTLLGADYNLDICRNLEKELGRYVDDNDVRLVIFDPVTEYIGRKNSNSQDDVNKVMVSLSAFAVKHDLAIVMVSHCNRKPRSLKDSYIGSAAWRNGARQAIGFVFDESRRKHLLEVTKANEGRAGAVYAYDIKEITRIINGEPARFAIAENVCEAPGEDLNEILARQYALDKAVDPDALSDAMHEVYEALLKKGGVALRSEIIEACHGKRESDVKRLTRARQQLERMGLVKTARLRETAARTIWYLTERYSSADEARETFLRNTNG
ncbi:hypothetical protein CS006_03395 [Bifidobacterium primatium]|uniref:AAA+ ATPase domain-containing protein n=1 Tax=Bifidobacterium primatium TaxID=2045438 RepID=A0A2M9HBJ0_9BIFI|nr:AAA family ATPase [Bifidobacterium primatium]PJM74184.1 hypothetical protein CS006_03395 [Bifidobacterium primatium]